MNAADDIVVAAIRGGATVSDIRRLISDGVLDIDRFAPYQAAIDANRPDVLGMLCAEFVTSGADARLRKQLCRTPTYQDWWRRIGLGAIKAGRKMYKAVASYICAADTGTVLPEIGLCCAAMAAEQEETELFCELITHIPRACHQGLFFRASLRARAIMLSAERFSPDTNAAIDCVLALARAGEEAALARVSAQWVSDWLLYQIVSRGFPRECAEVVEQKGARLFLVGVRAHQYTYPNCSEQLEYTARCPILTGTKKEYFRGDVISVRDYYAHKVDLW